MSLFSHEKKKKKTVNEDFSLLIEISPQSYIVFLQKCNEQFCKKKAGYSVSWNDEHMSLISCKITNDVPTLT